jgi:cell volume regulation protein A
VTIEELGGVLLFGAAVLLIAITAVRISSRTGLPSLLLYLGLGMFLGGSGLGIHFDDARLTGVLGYCALILILAEGGLTTRWDTIRPSIGPAAALATVGTLASVLVTAWFTRVLFDVDWTLALLLGAVLSSTDAAAVFSVLRRVPLPGRLAGLLESESGFNDAPVVIAVVALTEASQEGSHTLWWVLSIEAVAELAIGLVVGLGVGALGVMGLRRVALPSSGLYPIAVLGLIVASYGTGVTLHGSGFLAVYVSSLVLGNVRLPHGAAVRGFAEGLGWLAQIGLFVLLGLLSTPQRLADQILPAIVIGLVLLVVARPVSVLLSTTLFRIPWREQLFLSWAGLRGAVPIVLATIPVAGQIPNSTQLFDLVFVLVVLFTLVQAPALPWMARRLGISADLSTIGLDVESAPLGALDADVMLIRVGPTSRLHGVELFELRLPEGSNITLVIRDGRTFVPGPRTALRHGDDLILVTAAAVRGPTEKRLQEISSAGKLAGWLSPYPAENPPKGDEPLWVTALNRLRRPSAYTWHSNR